MALAHADEQLVPAAALEAANHPRLGEDAGLIAGVGELACRCRPNSTPGSTW